MDTPTVADVSKVSVEIVKSEGWLNSAYVIFKQVDGATYKVLIDDKELDAPLIRYYDTYKYNEATETDGQTTWTEKSFTKVVRADALGLAAGEHTMKVAAVGTENTSDYSTATMKVVDHDRSGFAFTGKSTPGAYNSDGTLKDNAIVIYVTGDTAKNVSYTAVKGTNSGKAATYSGLQDILSEQSLKNLTVPIDIRIIGTVTKDQLDRIDSSAEGLQIKTTSENGVTIEGVGHDATVWGFGFLIRNAKYVELSNLGVYNFMDDGISVDTDNSYLWIHNNDISYGAVGSDSDQAKGDGSLDFKLSTYSSLAYNHFWDSGKCNLLDAKAASSGGSNYLTYHHNWYDHSDSRHPRIRNATAVHVYNNYYDGNSKYGVGVTSGSSAFVEGNYFRDANDPMMSAGQGTDAQGSGTFSGEDGGVIKAWNNYIGGNKYNKVHFITNKKNYATGEVMSEPEVHTETVGTQNGSEWIIYDWVRGDASAFITLGSGATDNKDGGKAVQISAKKTDAISFKVPASTTKVIINARCGSSDATSTTLKVNGETQTVCATYADYTFNVSLSSDTTLTISSGDVTLNIHGIKVIASSAWSTTYTTGISLSDIDAYEVDSRTATVPESVTTKLGENKYSNFDTNLGDSGMGVVIAPTSPKQAKNDVMTYAGRHNPDFAWTFDNATEDANYGVIAALKTALVGYTSGLTATQGTSASSCDTGNDNTGNSSSGSTGSGDSGTTTPATPTDDSVASLAFNSSDTLSPVSAGVTFTLAKGTSAAESKDFYSSTGKVKILKMQSSTTISFTSPGTTSDKYTMTINYVAASAGALTLTPTGGTASEITLAAGGSVSDKNANNAYTTSVATEITGKTAYVISRKSTETYIHSIVITAK